MVLRYRAAAAFRHRTCREAHGVSPSGTAERNGGTRQGVSNGRMQDEPPGPDERRQGGRTARLLRWLTVLGLVAALVAGFMALLRRAAPATQFLAGALSRVLDRPVEIDEARVHIGTTVEITLRGVRVLDSEAPGNPPLFEVERADAHQSWPRLLAGQIVPVEWKMERPVLRWREGSRGGSRSFDIPRASVRITDGRIEWTRPGARVPLVVEDLAVDVRPVGFARDIGGRVAGRVHEGTRLLGQLDLELRGWIDDLALHGDLVDVDLSLLPAAPLSLRGRARGSIALRQRDATVEAQADLSAEAMEIIVPGIDRTLAPEESRARLAATWRPDELDLRIDSLVIDDLRAQGDVHLRTGEKGRLRASLRAEPFEPAKSRTRIDPLRLLALRFATFERIDRGIEAGRVEDLRVDVDVALDRLARVLSFQTRPAASELSLYLRARDGVFRPDPDTSALERIRGELGIRGNVIEAQRIEIERDGKPLPRIDVRIDGMDRLTHLPREERKIPRGPGASLDGLDATAASFTRSNGEPAAEIGLRVRDAEMYYTPLLLPLRDASARLRFPPGQIVIEEGHGVFGGAPARFGFVWDRAKSHITVDVTYLDGEAPAPPPGWAVPDGREGPRFWLGGSVEMDRLPLGPWTANEVTARARATGSEIELTEVRGVAAGGSLAAHGTVSIADRSGGTYGFDLEIEDADAGPSLEPFYGADAITGQLGVRGRVEGRLVPEWSFAREGSAALSLRARQGTLTKLPVLVVLARLPSLQGVRGLLGRPLPYDDIDVELELAEGRLGVRDFRLLGPELRILAGGHITLTSKPPEADMLVALLFLETVDRVIGSLPIVRNLMLGKDENLIGLYLRLTGPWAEPQASIVAPGAMQTAIDWATTIVGGSIKQLLRLNPFGSRSQTSPPTAEPPTPPSPDATAEPEDNDEDPSPSQGQDP